MLLSESPAAAARTPAALPLAFPRAPAGPRGLWFSVGMQVFVSLAATAYWLTWYLGDRTLLATTDTPDYYAFQDTFLAADGWMVLGCVGGAWGLVRRRSWALLCIVQSSSCAIFLGAMDVSYDLQHGVYALASQGLAAELTINALSFFCGVWGLCFGWANRAYFLSLDGR